MNYFKNYEKFHILNESVVGKLKISVEKYIGE